MLDLKMLDLKGQKLRVEGVFWNVTASTRPGFGVLSTSIIALKETPREAVQEDA